MRCGRFTGFIIVLLTFVATLGRSAPLAAGRQLTANELLPLANSQKQFKIIDGKDQGRLVPLTFQTDPANGKVWQLRFGDYGRIWLRSSAGALVMDRLDLFKSKSYVVYEPALWVLPAEIDSAGTVARQTGYRMYNVETGKLKRTGRVTHVVKRVSRSRFSTPAGVIDGYEIEIEHKMDMEYYSQLLLTATLGCRPDDGLVYGSAHYKVRKLGGLLTETKTSAAALSTRTVWPSH